MKCKAKTRDSGLGLYPPAMLECNTEMEKVGEIPLGQIKNDITEDRLFAMPKTLYQCPQCKTIILV